MGIRLLKGEGVTLHSGQYDLSHITIGLGWDAESQAPAEIPHLQIGISRRHEEFDLDAIAILLGHEGKILDLGTHDAAAGGRTSGDVIFHRAMHHTSGAIWLTSDNRTGIGDGDDEQIVVRLHEIAAIYQRIVFLVVIHDGKHRNQDFSRVANAYIRAVDAQGQEICRYDISANSSFAEACAMKFAEVVRDGDAWTFQAIGEPLLSDRFTELLRPFL